MAIDYGSSFTCAVMVTGGAGDGNSSEILEIDNSRYLPSVVWLDEQGRLLTGRDGTREGRLICYDTTIDGEEYFRIVLSHDDALIVTVILDTSATEAGEWWKDCSWMLD
jgi:hypothetical protein